MLANAGTSYYYGAFGAQRGYIISSESVATDSMIDGANVPIENRQGVTGFNDTVANRGGKTNIVLNTTTAVLITKDTIGKTIENSSITGAITSFDYDAAGYFADGDSLRFYFADTKYNATFGFGEVDSIKSGAIEAGDCC